MDPLDFTPQPVARRRDPVRKVVRRGHSTHVGYFQSDKMHRPVAYESTLEHDFLIRCEADPDVTAIFEQPEKIHWRDGAIRRHHIPDFLIVRSGFEELIEVKYLADIPQIAVRTSVIQRDQEKLSLSYRVSSEDTIRAEPGFTNAKTLMRGRRQLPLPSVRRSVLELLDANDGALSFFDIVRLAEKESSFINALFAMILAGYLELIDPGQPITGDSAVRRRP